MPNRLIVCIALLAGATASLNAADSLFVLRANGLIEHVDFDTLEIVESVQTEATFGPAEMVIGSDGAFYISNFYSIQRFDPISAQTEVVVTGLNVPNPRAAVFNYVDFDERGDLIFGMTGIFSNNQSRTRAFSLDLDADDAIATEHFQFQIPTPNVFDVMIQDSESLLAADYQNGRVMLVDRQTGAAEEFATGLDSIVSLFELEGDVYALSQFGDLHTIDLATGATEYHGFLPGSNHDFIGSAVASGVSLPAPSAAMVGMLVLGFSARRRRV